MKNKTISKLGFATLIIVVFYVFMVVFEGRINFSKDNLQFAIEWPKLNKVVLSKNSSDLEITKSENGTWVLPQKNNFPASEVMMRSLFLKLMDISTSEKIQVSASGIEKLGLNESGKASGHGVITLNYPEKEAGKIFLGALRSRKGETMQNEIALTGEYVRFSLSDQVFILPMAINLQTEIKEWLAKEVFNTKIADVYEFASYQNSKESKELVESYTAVRDDKLFLKDEPKFVLKSTAVEATTVKSSAINDVARSMETLSLVDVEPSSKEEFKSISIDGKIIYKLMDGQIVEIELLRLEKRPFIKLSTHYDANLVSEISDKYKAFKLENKDLTNVRDLPEIKQSEVELKNVEFSKWAYEVSDATYASLSKGINELLEKQKPETVSPLK